MSSTPQKIPLPKRDSRNIHKHDKVFISPSEKRLLFCKILLLVDVKENNIPMTLRYQIAI